MYIFLNSVWTPSLGTSLFSLNMERSGPFEKVDRISKVPKIFHRQALAPNNLIHHSGKPVNFVMQTVHFGIKTINCCWDPRDCRRQIFNKSRRASKCIRKLSNCCRKSIQSCGEILKWRRKSGKERDFFFRGVGEIVDIKKPVHAVSRTPRIEVLTFGFTNSAVSFYSLK